MATRALEQDFNGLTQSLGNGFAITGQKIGSAFSNMNPYGRRFAVTGLGAILALSLGAATAGAFRLPTEITDPAQPQDQTLAQSELPSETAARTYALENPPTYSVPTPKDVDATPSDVATDLSVVHDDAAATPTYTTPSVEPPSGAAEHSQAVPTPYSPGFYSSAPPTLSATASTPSDTVDGR